MSASKSIQRAACGLLCIATKRIRRFIPDLASCEKHRHGGLHVCGATGSTGSGAAFAGRVADPVIMIEGTMGETAVAVQVRSNVDHWKQMQESDYFETHPCYKGLRDFGGETDVSFIEWFTKLTPTMRVVVIGCGYGRETAHLAPQVGHVYGVDVSAVILDKAVRYLGEKDITNFTPVLVERYKTEIPEAIDLVFSVVVMQHLTRDLVFDYFSTLRAKLSENGIFVVQFLEELVPGAEEQDAELRVYEPSVSWTIAQLYQLSAQSGVKVREVRTIQVTPAALWHWACFSKT